MKLNILLFVLSLSMFSHAQQNNLLDSLDLVLLNKGDYFDKREQHINALKRKLTLCNNDLQCFQYMGDLYSEYRSYHLDSAYVYAQKRMQLAQKMGEINLFNESKMNLAEAYSNLSMYSIAITVLNQLHVSPQQLSYLYHIYHSTYLQLKEYAYTQTEKLYYDSLMQHYISKLLDVIPPKSIEFDMVKCLQLRKQGAYEEALSISLPYIKKTDFPPHAQAMIAENISETYRMLGDTLQQTHYLTLSSINDIKAGVREFVSLRRLAVLLFQQGDVERAYRYIKYAMEASSSSNSRLRILQTAESLPLIVESYENALRKKQQRLHWSLAFVSMLGLVLLLAVFYILSQQKQLKRANKSMDELNQQLQKLNMELSWTNASLIDSSKIKEEYIGYVFNLCSIYIDKLENFRKKVNRKLRDDKQLELIKETNANNLIDHELKEFFHSFDSVFLKIYPRFIDDFNALLLPEKQVMPKSGELLCPELRIFALVRLGITDSTRIAQFLHYSPQTVYNYRLKIRNNSKYSKDEFAQLLQCIGL